MSTREEKLLAARKRLREFQGKARADSDSNRKDSVATISPTPSNNSDARGPRMDSPSARLAYERRQTVELGSSPSGNDVVLDGLDDSAELHSQIHNLQLQLMRQNQAIAVLVGERNDAENALSRVQSELQQKSDFLEDVKSRHYEASRRIYELENASPRPMTSVMVSQVEEEMRGAQEIAAQKITQMEERLSELQARLSSKTSENDSLHEKCTFLSNALSVAEVKVQQLTSDETPLTSKIEDELKQINAEQNKQIELLQRRLQAVAREGEQTAHQFQVFADSQRKTFENKMSNVVEELRLTKEHNVSLSSTVEELRNQIKKLSEVDRQNDPMEARIDVLNKEAANFAQLLKGKDEVLANLNSQLTEKENTEKSLRAEFEIMLKKLKLTEAKIDGTPDAALLAAIESDKVAASRAVAQNQVLKQQSLELHEAFKRLNAEKLELTEKYSNAEQENSELKKQLNARKNDHHGHGHDSHGLNHDGHGHDHAHHGHDNDGHGHDHDHSQHSDEEETDWDIETLRRVVATLRSDKAVLVKRLHHQNTTNNHDHQHTDVQNHNEDHHHHHDDNCHEKEIINSKDGEINELKRAVQQLQEDKAHLLNRLGSPADDPEVQSLLQVKLRRTMDEIATLDEEKQRLEHLVLQLQGETETIGEYIALYHKQRLLLKQRSVEKDEQLIQLAKDKDELREKLANLNQLIAKLVEGKPNQSDTAGQVEETAHAIQTLITEIENNNVVHSQPVHSFEQCSCCSGRLITV